MKEQIRYVVWIDKTYKDFISANEEFYVADGFVKFYSGSKLVAMYNIDRVLKVQVE